MFPERKISEHPDNVYSYRTQDREYLPGKVPDTFSMHPMCECQQVPTGTGRFHPCSNHLRYCMLRRMWLWDTALPYHRAEYSYLPDYRLHCQDLLPGMFWQFLLVRPEYRYLSVPDRKLPSNLCANRSGRDS